MTAIPPVHMSYSFMEIQYHGPLRNNAPLQGHLLKLNFGQLEALCLKFTGYEVYYLNLVSKFINLFSKVTILELLLFAPILSTIRR